MESRPNSRPAGIQTPYCPADLTSSSGPPSATSTRKTSPASLTHHNTSTISSSSLKNLPSASSAPKELHMKSSRESWADQKAPRDDEGRTMDTHAPRQGPDGSASPSQIEMIGNLNHNVGHVRSHWQNIAVQNMIAVEGFGRAGRQSRISTDQQKAEAAPTFGNVLGLDHRQNTLAEGSFGRPGDPYNVVDHQNGSIAGGLGSSSRDVHVARGQANMHLLKTHGNTLAAQSLNSGHQNGSGIRGKSCLDFRGLQGTTRAHPLRDGYPETSNGKGENQGSDWNFHMLSNAYGTGEDDSVLGLAWSPYRVNENAPAVENLYYAPANVHGAGGENDRRHQGLLSAQSYHDSCETVLAARSLHNHCEPLQDFDHGLTSVYDADGRSQNLQSSHRGILAAQYHHNAHQNAGDAEGRSQSLSEEDLSAEDCSNDQQTVLAARGPGHAPQNIYDTRGYGSLVAQKPFSAHGDTLAPQSLHRNLPNVCGNPAHLSIKAGSSDHITHSLPNFYNSTATSEPAVSTNLAAVRQHQHHHHHHHHSNNFSASSTPGFSSSSASSIFGNNVLSVGTNPYVSITSPSTTNLSRDNASNIAASSQQLEPHTDTSPSIKPSPSVSTASSSSSNTHTATMFPPRGIVISDADMERAMAYCFDRGNGHYTRLVPVDILPFSLREFPARVSSDEGMIVLPVPRMVGPDGQPANIQLIPHVAGHNVTVSSTKIISPFRYLSTHSGRMAFGVTSFEVH